ncbi:hypothetical protein E2320_014484, partial [Naja naja]
KSQAAIFNRQQKDNNIRGEKIYAAAANIFHSCPFAASCTVEESKGPDLLLASLPTCPPLTSQEPLRPSKQQKRLRRLHQPPVDQPEEEVPLPFASSLLAIYRFNLFHFLLYSCRTQRSDLLLLLRPALHSPPRSRFDPQAAQETPQPPLSSPNDEPEEQVLCPPFLHIVSSNLILYRFNWLQLGLSLRNPKARLAPASPLISLHSQQLLQPFKQHKRLRRRHYPPVDEAEEELLQYNHFNWVQLGFSPSGRMRIVAMPLLYSILCFLGASLYSAI